MIDAVGWRLGWYISGGTTLVVSILGLWALPKTTSLQGQEGGQPFHRFRTRIDWIGAGLGPAFMALLCYLLAILSANPSHIKCSECIAILCLAVLALPAFIAWSHHQVKKGNPALIPNALWKNRAFSSICATVALSNGVLNAMELFTSLFFQEVQGLSALQASIRILPSLVAGVLINVLVGQFVHRIPAFWIVTAASAVCAGSPLFMALVHPSTPYWANAFVAQVLQPISFGALYTVGLIVITDSFAKDTQALAGAAFSTASQFGNALGLAVLQVISSVVSKSSSNRNSEKQALMNGYRASFWIMFGSMVLCAIIGFWGLLKTGKVGLKQD
ncbi:major facilitator superfamily domain-containing protein [Aspergillus spinulosporus]